MFDCDNTLPLRPFSPFDKTGIFAGPVPAEVVEEMMRSSASNKARGSHRQGSASGGVYRSTAQGRSPAVSSARDSPLGDQGTLLGTLHPDTRRPPLSSTLGVPLSPLVASSSCKSNKRCLLDL